MDFSDGPQEFSLVETDARYYGEFMNRVDDKAIIQKFADKNLYEVTFKNEGGLVMPVIVEFAFEDGTKTVEKLPAEIWRMNEEKAVKVFAFDKKVTNITLDPNLETADTDVDDNTFPRAQAPSKMDEFKEKSGK